MPVEFSGAGHAYDGAAIENLFVDLFLDAHGKPPREIVLARHHRRSAARTSGGPVLSRLLRLLLLSAAGICSQPNCGAPTSTAPPGRSRRRRGVKRIRVRWRISQHQALGSAQSPLRVRLRIVFSERSFAGGGRPLRRGSLPWRRRCASHSRARGVASESSTRRCARPPSVAAEA